MSDEPTAALRPGHELALLAVHVLAVADVDCPPPVLRRPVLR